MTPESSRLNWRQGFFRFWVVGTALFVIAIAAISYIEIKAEFVRVDSITWDRYWAVPKYCFDARGVAGKDFTYERYPNNPYDTCWYELPKFRQLYPEFNNLSDRELGEKLYAVVGKGYHTSNPWTTLLKWIGIALSIPLAVLIFAATLAWALSCFKAKRDT